MKNRIKKLPKTKSNSTLPLFIEGNWRVSEGSGKLASLLPSESQFETGFRAQYGEAERELFDLVIQ
ncbi:hypothetical protein [uncultured Butyricimonas sp.]|uniref:hypothetical protein n=1 Tax=uncultured Butyricimonas sp. TaxID=1268785 RepID=UPI0026DDC496|nr:hypothetical protein [uncultured Butyricimonas sp.]